MTQTFLIARQEFIKYVTRRGFLISILMFPLWIMIVIFVPQWTGQTSEVPRRHDFTIIDHSGGVVQGAVLAAIARKRDREALNWIYNAPPPALANADESHFAAAAERVLDKGSLDTILVVPANFDSRHAAQLWRTDSADPVFRDFLADALTGALRLQAVRRVAPQVSDPTLFDVSADLEARNPSRDAANAAVDQGVSIALAIILFIVSVMNSSVLLQGVVEEKSTRMIEVLLSCATPREITAGKLIGVIAVALTTLVIWGAVLFVLMSLASHETASLVLNALKTAGSLQTVPLLLLYFLCGLLIYGSLFLAIGSMANSLADAQSLLGPSMLILMLPNLMIAGVMHDPNGPLASTLSWVPIYTPFFMMLRISSHPPAWQLWGTAALAIATTFGMVLWTGRMFARHVLTTERPPSFGNLLRGLVSR
jgi:ABC-2 type transport system permease protein